MTSLDTEAIFSPLGEELNHIKAVFIIQSAQKRERMWNTGSAAVGHCG